MFAFAKDALDVIGQGTVKKTKMAAETTDSVAPQSSYEDAKKAFDEAAIAAQIAYSVGATVDDVTPGSDDDIYIVTNALAVPLAAKYAAKDTARVLIVESNEKRAHAAAAAVTAANKDLSVATALPFEFCGPKKVTVTTAIVLAGLLSKRKNLGPYSHVIVADVTSFSIGIQSLLGQLKRVINNQGAKGHHRVLLCGDCQITSDVVKPLFNKLKVGAMAPPKASPFVNVDQSAAFTKKQLVKVPTSQSKMVFAPYTSFAAEQAKEILAWAKVNIKAEGVIVVFGQKGLDLEGAAVPVVDVATAGSTKGLSAVVATSAAALTAAGIEPIAVIDLGITTVFGANTPAEALIQDPRIEFASVVEVAERRNLAGNHPYFALYPAVVPRALHTFDARLSIVDRNELLQATRNGLDLRSFVAPIRESALDEALTAFAELGLIQSINDPTQTFLGEVVSRLNCLTVEMGTFVAIASAVGLGEAAAAVAAANSTCFYKDTVQKSKLRSKYDPDDSNSSDLLADAIVFLTESEHSSLSAEALAAATKTQSLLLRTLANYLPPSEKHSVSELRQAVNRSASVLAYLLAATLAATACKMVNGHGEFLNIRSTEHVNAPAEGSVVAFPSKGAMATAASLTKTSATDISFDGVTLVCTSHFNAAQILLRPVVQHSAAADTNAEGENIVKFAVASNGLTNNYHVPVEMANKVIDARAAICTGLGLLMLRRLMTPNATSTEEYVAAIRRKSREFNFVRHMEETARKIELAVQETSVSYVITTFMRKQTSVLSPSEAGVLEEGAPAAVATDVATLDKFFEKNLAAAAKREKAEAAAPTTAAPPAATEVPATLVDDDGEDFFAKNGPILDDDDEE